MWYLKATIISPFRYFSDRNLFLLKCCVFDQWKAFKYYLWKLKWRNFKSFASNSMQRKQSFYNIFFFQFQETFLTTDYFAELLRMIYSTNRNILNKNFWNEMFVNRLFFWKKKLDIVTCSLYLLEKESKIPSKKKRTIKNLVAFIFLIEGKEKYFRNILLNWVWMLRYIYPCHTVEEKW